MAQDIWKSLVKRKFPAPEHCTERARPWVVPRDANFKAEPRIMRCLHFTPWFLELPCCFPGSNNCTLRK